MIERNWYGCHSGGWKGEITDEAFAHPAKFARGLIRRIYEHCLEQGHLKPGDLVLDPFGGVALGGCDAIPLGLNWLGFELEEKFVTLGNENIDLWYERMLKAEQWGLTGWGTAEIIQGDSRYLAQVLREAGGVVSSPPYARSNPEANSKGVNIEKQWQTYRSQGGGMSLEGFRQLQEKHSQGYGSRSTNLANLPEGNHAAVVSSPPYAESVNQPDGANDDQARVDRKRQVGIDIEHKPNVGGPNSVLNKPQAYGTTPSQLGAMRVVSSPPYAETLDRGRVDPAERRRLAREMGKSNAEHVSPIDMENVGKRDQEYGESEGQLGAMRVVSSPPYENNTGKGGETKGFHSYDGNESYNRSKRDYIELESVDNLGNTTADDFWSAARLIMQQVAMLLPPDAVSVWVCKRFVKEKKIVQFSRQWAALGEACGFETIEWIRAWLIEDRGAQYDLFGGLEKRQVARKSFFRRLYESKYPENSIDWEDVIIQRRLAPGV